MKTPATKFSYTFTLLKSKIYKPTILGNLTLFAVITLPNQHIVQRSYKLIPYSTHYPRNVKVFRATVSWFELRDQLFHRCLTLTRYTRSWSFHMQKHIQLMVRQYLFFFLVSHTFMKIVIHYYH